VVGVLVSVLVVESVVVVVVILELAWAVVAK